MNDSPRRPPPAPEVTGSDWDSLNKGDAVEYHADTDTYRTSFDSTAESVYTAVVSTVAAVSETKPLELPPLHSVCDPGALAKLTGSPTADPSRGDLYVSFGFAGYQVTVHDYGIIAVKPLRAKDPPSEDRESDGER